MSYTYVVFGYSLLLQRRNGETITAVWTVNDKEKTSSKKEVSIEHVFSL